MPSLAELLTAPATPTVLLPGLKAGMAEAEAEPLPRPGATPRGCAWYDSSFELAQGLEVTPLDDGSPELAASLPWELWLQRELGTRRGGGPMLQACSATLGRAGAGSPCRLSQATSSAFGIGRPNR